MNQLTKWYYCRPSASRIFMSIPKMQQKQLTELQVRSLILLHQFVRIEISIILFTDVC